jgi:hypothetical protein
VGVKQQPNQKPHCTGLYSKVLIVKLILAVFVQGKLMYPPPAPKVDPGAPAAAATTAVAAKKEPPPPPNYFNITLKDSFMYTAGLTGALGKFG